MVSSHAAVGGGGGCDQPDLIGFEPVGAAYAGWAYAGTVCVRSRVAFPIATRQVRQIHSSNALDPPVLPHPSGTTARGASRFTALLARPAPTAIGVGAKRSLINAERWPMFKARS